VLDTVQNCDVAQTSLLERWKCPRPL